MRSLGMRSHAGKCVHLRVGRVGIFQQTVWPGSALLGTNANLCCASQCDESNVMFDSIRTPSSSSKGSGSMSDPYQLPSETFATRQRRAHLEHALQRYKNRDEHVIDMNFSVFLAMAFTVEFMMMNTP